MMLFRRIIRNIQPDEPISIGSIIDIMLEYRLNELYYPSFYSLLDMK